MKILKIVSSHDEGGVLSCETQFTRILRERNIEVDMVIVGNGKRRTLYEEVCNRSFIIEDFRVKFSGSSWARLCTLGKTLLWGRKQAKAIAPLFAEKYDAVIYHRESFMFLAGFLARRLGARCYWQIAGTINSSLARIVHRTTCKLLSITPLANSQYTRSTFGKGCKHVIYPGFYKKRLLEDTGADEFTFEHQAGEPVFGMLARVCHAKAQDMLVEGFLQSGAIQSHGAHLILGGNIESPDSLERIRHLSGKEWGQHIHYIGLISNVARFYQTVDVAFNSMRETEAFGISVAEAIFMKKPVIAYYLGGPSEIIEEGKNGWLVHGKTPNDYANAIQLALAKKDQWPQIGEYGHRSSAKFDAEANVTKLVTIIAEQNDKNRPVHGAKA